MNQIEWKILRSLVSRVISIERHWWNALKYQIEYGPYFSDWPGYVAALEMRGTARRLIFGLPTETKQTLLNEWKRRPRLIDRKTEEEILDQYALIVVEKVVTRGNGVVFR